ncbi:MAG: hypothetical protein LBR80_13925 [Deltaproteobacteria bacterium]|nr:hypothetical protein [Deltaproteobacteria bacterium]
MTVESIFRALVFRTFVGQIPPSGQFRQVFLLNSAENFRPSLVSSELVLAFRPHGQAATAPSGSFINLSSENPGALALWTFPCSVLPTTGRGA